MLTPAQRAAVEARRAERQTSEYQHDVDRNIKAYRQEYPPARDVELVKALAELRRERQRQA